MAASTNSLAHGVVKKAIDAANMLLQDIDKLDLSSVRSCGTSIEDLYRAMQTFVASHVSGGAAVIKKYKGNMRALLPLAEAVAQAKSKIQDGTLLDFLGDAPID